MNSEKKCLVTSCGTSKQEVATCPRTLSAAFMKNLQNVQGTSKAKCKEIFLRDLRKAMQRLKGCELKEVFFSVNYIIKPSLHQLDKHYLSEKEFSVKNH